MKQKKLFPFCLIPYTLYLIPFSFLLSTCKTDLNVNAPWKDVTVVYGLLNQNDTVHFIKINKSFLGPADAYQMAKERDSSEYNNPYSPPMGAKVEEWKSGSKSREWTLKDSTITNKDPGTFYSPKQTVYYFYATDLDSSAQYHLTVNVDLSKTYGHDTTKTVTAKTELIDGFILNGGYKFNLPCSGGSVWPSCMGFYGTTDYLKELDFQFNTVADARRYQLALVFVYDETKTGIISTKSFIWDFLPVKTTNTSGGDAMVITINGEDFYKQVAKNVLPDADVTKRMFQYLYFTMSVAGDDFSTYLDANQPSTGIIQEKPEFTNVQNGIGIFSARYKTQSSNKGLTIQSLNELFSGKYTFNLGFCGDASSSVPCH